MLTVSWFQVVDESTTRYDYVSENEKFYVVKSEWFWTRIAEGYAPEDDFLYKDVRMPKLKPTFIMNLNVNVPSTCKA